MFPHLKSTNNLEAKTDWAIAFWQAVANVLPDNPWQLQNTENRSQQRQESVAVSAVAIQALGMLGRDFYQEGIPSENLSKWLISLAKIDWRRENPLWHERGVTQIGSSGNQIISNTKTTVESCYKFIREYIGITPKEGII